MSKRWGKSRQTQRTVPTNAVTTSASLAGRTAGGRHGSRQGRTGNTHNSSTGRDARERRRPCSPAVFAPAGEQGPRNAGPARVGQGATFAQYAQANARWVSSVAAISSTSTVHVSSGLATSGRLATSATGVKMCSFEARPPPPITLLPTGQVAEASWSVSELVALSASTISSPLIPGARPQRRPDRLDRRARSLLSAPALPERSSSTRSHSTCS